MSEGENKPVIVNETWVDLKLKAFRAEVRLLVVLSLLANQVFAHVNIPAGITTAGLAIVGIKLLTLVR